MNDQTPQIKKYFYDPEETLTPEEILSLQEKGAAPLTASETEAKPKQHFPFSITAIGTLFNL